MQSDPWWSFAMAINVYMVFFFGANPKRLSYWWAYCLICYGVPLIPALWLLLLRAEDGGRVYGNATVGYRTILLRHHVIQAYLTTASQIWCWIDKDWRNLRIYTYYLPIWVCIALSLCIYIAVGYYVFRQRNQLRNLSLSNPSRDTAAGPRDSGEKVWHPQSFPVVQSNASLFIYRIFSRMLLLWAALTLRSCRSRQPRIPPSRLLELRQVPPESTGSRVLRGMLGMRKMDAAGPIRKTHGTQ